MRAQFTTNKLDKSSVEERSDVVGDKPTSKTIQFSISWNWRTASIGMFIVIISGSLIWTGMFLARSQSPKPEIYSNLPGQAAAPAQLSDKEVKAIVGRVGKHMVLPEGTPQIVVIANVDQLKIDQPFFRTAANGDQLLVYPNKVILYRSSSDQIVDIASIRPNPTGAPSQSPTPSKSAIPPGL